MTDKDFAKCFFIQKESAMDAYFNDEIETAVKHKIKQLNLDEKQTEILKQLIDGVLTDTLYTILLGLDGCTQIGGEQKSYKIFDEENNELTNSNIERYAYHYFHENKR